MNNSLKTLLFMERQLYLCGSNLNRLEQFSRTSLFRDASGASPEEISSTLMWLKEYGNEPFPDDPRYNFSEKLPLPSSLYGTAGEARGAKHKACKPGRRLCGTRCIPSDHKCKYDESHQTLEAQKFSVKEASGLTNSLPKDLRNKFQKKFPNIFSDPKKEEFLWHLLYSSHSTKEGNIMIPKEVMHRFAKDRNGEAFLQEFADAMGTTPKTQKPYFQFTGSSYKYAKSREARLELPITLEKAFKEDLRNPDFKKERVFSIGGAEYNQENIEKVKEIQRNYALEVAASLKLEDQKSIALYHANQRETEMPKFHFDKAYQIANNLENEDSKQTALRILNNLRSNPVGYYRPSEVTTRMFSANHIQGLKSEVRAALIPEMVEADLVSCHLSIMADLRNNNKLREVMKLKLEQDVSLWDSFKADFTAAGYPWDNRTKKAIKEQFYALCYGGTRPGAAARLTKMSKEDPSMSYVGERDFKDTLFNNEIFKTIQDLGDDWRRDLLEKGEGCNHYGQCFSVNSNKKARSVQSAIAQSYETALVKAAAYPMKGENPEDLPWKVVYFAHDGVGIVPKEGYTLEQAQASMNQRVQARGKEIGINLAAVELKPGDLAALEDLGYTAEEIEILRKGGNLPNKALNIM